MLTPHNCLICGSEWKGGHEVPGKEMKTGLRVFYKCGGSLCICKIENLIDASKYTLFIKCHKEKHDKKGKEKFIFKTIY